MAKSTWTDKQKDFLAKHINDMTFREIGEKLDKKTETVKMFAKRNGIEKANKHRSFTQEEIDFIESHFGTMSLRQVAKHLHRSHMSLRHYQFKNQLGPQPMNLTNHLTVTQAAEVLGMTIGAVAWRCEACGLKSFKKSKFRLIRIDTLFKWMQKNPEKWDVTKCDESFFCEQEWFQEIREKAKKQMIKERWGKWYDVK